VYLVEPCVDGCITCHFRCPPSEAPPLVFTTVRGYVDDLSSTLNKVVFTYKIDGLSYPVVEWSSTTDLLIPDDLMKVAR